MANCPHCGAPLGENAIVCAYCGSKITKTEDLFEKEGQFFTQNQNYVNYSSSTQNEDDNDRRSVLLNLIGFLFPVIGLIIYLRYKRTRPVLAESLKVWIIIGFAREIIGSALNAPYNRISSVRLLFDNIFY